MLSVASSAGIDVGKQYLNVGFFPGRQAVASRQRTNWHRQDKSCWLGREDSNQSMHFIRIAFNRRKTLAKLRRVRQAVSSRPEIQGEGEPIVIPTRFA
jgi:hypothetical protein